jgi:Phage capsid family
VSSRPPSPGNSPPARTPGRGGWSATRSTVGYCPWTLNPSDWEKIETTRNTSGNFDLGSAVDTQARRAWGVPVAVSAATPALTAWLLATDAVNLSTDGEIRTDWGTPGDTFQRNQLVARNEVRAQTDVLRPFGCVRGTLPA